MLWSSYAPMGEQICSKSVDGNCHIAPKGHLRAISPFGRYDNMGTIAVYYKSMAVIQYI